LDTLVLPALAGRTALEGIFQHMIRNPDWAYSDLFDALDLIHISQQRFFRFLELLVHPSVRHDEAQNDLLALINSHVERDGLRLVPSEVLSGYQVYAVAPIGKGVDGPSKNLIFAANGPKPEIVLSDAINNDIRIIKNAEHCLVYARPLPSTGLRWEDLVKWYAELMGIRPDQETARALYRRLEKSLGSDAEKVLFRTYFKKFLKPLAESLPALVPQVYLHYDPYTFRQLGTQRLLRQRMDFLLLLSHGQRIVVEVDGQQHYSEGDTPSPRRYAEMVMADRELRLAGYEVYRFGGHELFGTAAEVAVTSFFRSLFAKHSVGPMLPPNVT
jgi:hypothetical protein